MGGLLFSTASLFAFSKHIRFRYYYYIYRTERQWEKALDLYFDTLREHNKEAPKMLNTIVGSFSKGARPVWREPERDDRYFMNPDSGEKIIIYEYI